MYQPWRIELFGALRAKQGEVTITRFRSQKIASLLAYLAFYQNRMHAREELIERFWPGDDPAAGRVSLRTALASLRRQLEPPGTPQGGVLAADRMSVQLNPAAVTVDVLEFEAALRAAERSGDPAERIAGLARATELYCGELLPGHYDEWVLTERERLAQRHLDALGRLAQVLEQAGALGRAADYAHRAAAADPMNEEIRHQLMRLLAATGQTDAALRHYHQLERVLQDEFNETPGAAVRAYAEELRVGAPRPPRQALPEAGPGSDARLVPVPRSEPSRPDSPPPAAAGGGHLPLQFTRFFGRHEEVASVSALLRSRASRLVTLTGPGGSGKTRLAVEVARQMEATFGTAIWFVPLADLGDPRLIAQAVLDALETGGSSAGAADPLPRIRQALGERPALLVLDNFEHLADEGAPAVADLLRRLPTLTCLVTSRQRLALDAERVFPVEPLSVPTRPGTPERLMEFASVQLFVDRAQAVRPDFAVTGRNAAAVAALCERLEGIPLALELAASRSMLLSPAQMLEQLTHRLPFLVSRRRDIAPRHRTLRAAIEWSYDLLPPELQRLFARLSVFRGGWTLAAAEAVCEEPFALERLGELQDRSLILAAPGKGEEMRCRMLETLREFAREQLAASEWSALSHRHARYFLGLVEQAEPHLTGADPAPWLDRLEAEHDNLRAALIGSRDQEDSNAQLRLATAIAPFWHVRGHFREGSAWLGEVLGRSADAAPELRAKALNAASHLVYRQSDYAGARAFAEAALAIWRDLGDRPGTAAALSNLGNVAYRQNDLFLARALFQECLEIRRRIGDDAGAAASLCVLASVARLQGDFAAARALVEESIALYRRLGNKKGLATSLETLGNLLYCQGDYPVAVPFMEQGLALRREIGDRWGIGNALSNLASAQMHCGNYAAADSLLEEGVPILRELGDKNGLAVALTNQGEVAQAQGDPAAARSLYAESLRLFHEIGDRPSILYLVEKFAALATLEERSHARAVRLFAAASALRDAPGAGRLPHERGDASDGDVAHARAALGPEAFAAAFAAGKSMSLEQTVAYALASPSV